MSVQEGIIHGDCVTELAKLEADCVDLAFTDPPFNIGYSYDEYDDKRSCADYLDWSKRWMSAVVRVLRPCGAFWLAIGDEYAAELKVIATRELGLICRSWVVWYYTFGVHCNSKFTRSHAHLFYFLKRHEGEADRRGRANEARRHEAEERQNDSSYPFGGEPLRAEPLRAGAATKPRRGNVKPNRATVVDLEGITFNDEAIRVPSARQLVYADKRANPRGRVPDDTWLLPPQLPPDAAVCDGFILRPQDIPARFPPYGDTWFFSRVAGTFNERRGFHGCQMPEQLLGRIIKACSNKGDLVLDPFAGSGTTPAVAKKLSRRFVGFEVSKDYVERIKGRLNGIHPGDVLKGALDPLHSAPTTAKGRALLGNGGAGLRKRGRPRKQGPGVLQAEHWSHPIVG